MFTASLLLENYLIQELHDQNDGSIVYQQDSKMSHFRIYIHTYFDAVFPGK